jgi:Transposase DDE domain
MTVAGQTAVHWRLMTTHVVDSLEQALQILQWYRWRWRIEQLFATLKLAGLDLEATQLESISAIQRTTDDTRFICCGAYITDG